MDVVGRTGKKVKSAIYLTDIYEAWCSAHFPVPWGCWACRQSATDKVDANFCKAFSEPFVNVLVDRIKKGGLPTREIDRDV